MGLTTSSWNRVPLISGGCAAPPHLCFGGLRKGVSHEVGFNSLHRFRVQRLTLDVLANNWNRVLGYIIP